MWHKNQGTFLIYLQCWLSPNSHPLMHPLLQTIGQWIDAFKMDLTKAELLASRWAATTINLCHWGICKEADWEEEPNSFCSLFSLFLLCDVWSLLGAWTLRLFRICHVPLICKLQEKALYGLISHANTSNKSDICSGVPSNRLCKAPSRVSRSLGSLILSPGKSFCSQGTIKSLLAFCVCTEHTMPPILRD